MRICRLVFLFGLVPLFWIVSCSSPPANGYTESLLLSTHAFFNSDEEPASIADLFYSFRRIHNARDLISTVKEGDHILLTGQMIEPNDKTLVYTAGGNRLKVHQTVYITCNKKRKLFYSLDGITWYHMANKKRQGELNIEYSVPAESTLDKKNGILDIRFKWRADKSDRAVVQNMDKKPLVTMAEGLIFYGADSSRNTVDLADYFLEVPAGSNIEFFIDFEGNLINSSSDGIVNDLEIVKDFSIYTSDDSDYKLGISLDGIHWNFNIFAFSFTMYEFFHARSPDSLEYNRVMTIVYGD